MDAGDLDETDRLLQVARLLRLSEAGFARDEPGALVEKLDPCGERLDWYSLGLADALRVSRGHGLGRLRLLVYLMLLCDRGPGEAAVRATEHLVARLHDAGPARYIEAGRTTVLDTLAGRRIEPGRYWALLAADSGPMSGPV